MDERGTLEVVGSARYAPAAVRDNPAPNGTKIFQPNETIEAHGEVRPQLRLIVTGWAARASFLKDGRRQITRFLVPGDLCGVPVARGAPAPCATIAITKVKLTPAVGETVGGESQAASVRVRQAETAEHEGMVRHIVRLGRLSAHERLAHLLLELYERLSRAGLRQGAGIPLPLTQDVLADALGLSVVHTNRVVQQLRRDAMIELRSGRLVLPDPERLARICGYEFATSRPAETRSFLSREA